MIAAPVVVHATTADWVVAPAVAPSSEIAWLEVGRRLGDPRILASFHGDRLRLRIGKRARSIVNGACTQAPCDDVQAPVALAGGGFAYAAGFGEGGEYVGAVDAAGVSRLIGEEHADEDADEPAAAPALVAATGDRIAWVERERVVWSPAVGGAHSVAVAKVDTGGAITSLAGLDGALAWTARTAAGGTELRVRLANGEVQVRAAEPDAAKGVLSGVAIAPEGVILVVRTAPVRGGRVQTLRRHLPDGTVEDLVVSGTLPRSDADRMRPSASGTRVAVRVRTGRAGSREEIWLLDTASGQRRKVVVVDRNAARLSNPALSADRLVWARTDLSGGWKLKRSRIFSARMR